MDAPLADLDEEADSDLGLCPGRLRGEPGYDVHLLLREAARHLAVLVLHAVLHTSVPLRRMAKV